MSMKILCAGVTEVPPLGVGLLEVKQNDSIFCQ
jgi:hypothetical protein